jgi:hypothetical protein
MKKGVLKKAPKTSPDGCQGAFGSCYAAFLLSAAGIGAVMLLLFYRITKADATDIQ